MLELSMKSFIFFGPDGRMVTIACDQGLQDSTNSNKDTYIFGIKIKLTDKV